MPFRGSDDSAIRAVRALSREAADAEVPAVDWDRVEQGFLAEIARGEHPALSEMPAPRHAQVAPASRVGSPWTAALTAAAAVALALGVQQAELQPALPGS